MHRPLLDTLKLIEEIAHTRPSLLELMQRHGRSERQVMRYLDEARDLGARITMTKDPSGTWFYSIANWPEIDERGILKRWIELETTHRVV